MEKGRTRLRKVYGEGPTKSASGQFADQKIPFNDKDIRFTTKGSVLYAITLGIPVSAIEIRLLSLKSNTGKIATIKLVGSNNKVIWSQKGDYLIIETAKTYPTEFAVVYKITFQPE